MAHEQFPTGAILTQGLGLGVEEGFLLAHYHMIFLAIDIIVEPVVPTVPQQGGGGGVSARFDDDDDIEPIQYRITLVMKNDHFGEYRSTFTVSEKRKDVVVNVVGFANATRKFINVQVSKLKRVATLAKVNVNRFTKRR